MISLVFFGSFQHYSALILESLINHKAIKVVGVITTSPMPVGRKQIITKTPVHLLAEKHSIPVLTPQKLDSKSLDTLSSYFLLPTSQKNEIVFLTAGYGKILPPSWLAYPSLGSLNLHFSLLPKYRGANPAEWAIMCAETTTGITLMQMNQSLDGGDIIEQRQLAIIGEACPEPSQRDTRETLYQKLYTLGAQKVPQWLQSPLALPKPQGEGGTPYAALLKRDDGFLPWQTLQKAINGKPLALTDFPSKHLQTALTHCQAHQSNFSYQSFILRLPRALAGYPSLWTIIPTKKRGPAFKGAGGDKRMKILSFQETGASAIKLHQVQIEGQQPALFNQVKNTIA